MPRKLKSTLGPDPERINTLYGKPDCFYWYLAINKMTLKLKELFPRSHTRTSVLKHLENLKYLLKRRENVRDKYLDIIDNNKEEEQVNELDATLDKFEQWIDNFSWKELQGTLSNPIPVETTEDNIISNNIEPSSSYPLRIAPNNSEPNIEPSSSYTPLSIDPSISEPIDQINLETVDLTRLYFSLECDEFFGDIAK